MLHRFDYNGQTLTVSVAFVTYIAHGPDADSPGRVTTYLHIQGQTDPLKLSLTQPELHQFLQRWEQFSNRNA